MFPDPDMPGVDLVLPDFTYLRENADRIDGASCSPTATRTTRAASPTCCASCACPIYGSALTLGLARNRIDEAGLVDRAEFIPVVADGERRRIGPFDVEFIPVTHSVPHGFATAFHTPQGVILHSGDFKLDLTPVDGRRTDLARIGAIATDRGHPAAPVRLDQRRGARATPSPRRRSAGRSPASSTARAGRRIIVACFASHIHRVQQIADAAVASGRRVATLGRSMKQERRAGPRARPAAASPRRPSSTSRRSTTSPPGRSASSRPAPRASRCRRWRSWPPARTAGSRSSDGDVVVIMSRTRSRATSGPSPR